MRVVIAGLGSIGRRHLRNLHLVCPEAEVVVLRRPGSGDAPSGVTTVFDVEAALATRPDAAIVAGPAPTHIPVAMAFARAGVSLLVEKPISHELLGVDELLAACTGSGVVLTVGYNLRFHEPLRRCKQLVEDGAIGSVLYLRAEVGQHLSTWRPAEDHREGISARASTGGGALLELSHEIDYARWLAGDVAGVIALTASLGEPQLEVEDVAELVLRFESGAVGSVHLDMVQLPGRRACQVVGSRGTILWDGTTDEVRLGSADGGWQIAHDAGPVSRDDSYIAELAHFLRCVRGEADPVVTGADGRAVLEIIDAARRSAIAPVIP